MSLSIDGVWKAGVWATTVWADGVWREGAAPVVTPSRLNLDRGGGGYKDKEEWYRRMTQDLLERYYALQRRTLPPPETPVAQPVVEKVLEPYTSVVRALKAKPETGNLRAQIQTMERDVKVLRKRIDHELEKREKQKWILKMDQEVIQIALLIDD